MRIFLRLLVVFSHGVGLLDQNIYQFSAENYDKHLYVASKTFAT